MLIVAPAIVNPNAKEKKTKESKMNFRFFFFFNIIKIIYITNGSLHPVQVDNFQVVFELHAMNHN